MNRQPRVLFRLLPLLVLVMMATACGGEDGQEPAPLAPIGGEATQPLVPATEIAGASTPATSPPLVEVENTPADPSAAATPTTAAAAPAPGQLTAPFPPNVNPLTGETVADPAVLQRRPLAIKVSNYPPVVRPQSGLNLADLVFEHYAEGGVTRFTAIFYDSDASPIGSIRSGRLIDLEIPRMFDAAFAYSGASGPVRQRIADSPFFNRVISPDFGHGGFFRVEDPSKAFEHTLFTDTASLRAILEERGQNTPPSLNGSFLFSEDIPAGGSPVNGFEVRYSGSNVYWQYEAAMGRWLRWIDGEVHVDANSGEQLHFANVIVLGAHHVDTEILEDMVGGGHYSIQIQLWGEGPVSIFRDGQRFDGRWRRAAETDMVTFYDNSGNPLPLDIGNSFVQLVPLGFTGIVVSE
jgi:hypothetical protein